MTRASENATIAKAVADAFAATMHRDNYEALRTRAGRSALADCLEGLADGIEQHLGVVSPDLLKMALLLKRGAL